MKRIFYLSSLIVVWLLCFHGQPGGKVRINLKINGKKDTTLYLACYFGDKILKVDSVKLDHEGKAIFVKDSLQKEGLYLFYLNDKHYFEFLLGSHQELDLYADFSDVSRNRFKGAPETEAFHDYQLFLGKQKSRQTAIQKQLEGMSEKSDSFKLLQGRLNELNVSMESYWKENASKFQGTFLADFYRSMLIPESPSFTPPAGSKNPDSLKWVFQYNFMKNHYWDNFNFERAGLLRTPLFQEKLNTYIKKMLLQIPDSMTGPMLKLIERSKKNEEIYHYVFLYLLNEANQSQIMGMDKNFVILSEKYLLNDKKPWLDTAVVRKIRERVAAVKPNLIGNTAPDLKLPDQEGNYFSLRQVNAKYTLLLFWEPDCSHCQKATPQLNKDLYQVLKGKGV
ncbi:MAG: DUF5106 domain-containing protein, partial [Marinilabiliales bacterium]|nr:DUF5106 domain-containing protein [Marinilabiliales bacterium]